MNSTVEKTEILPKTNESSDEEVKTNSGMKRTLAKLSEESDSVDNDYPYPLRRKSIMRARMENMAHMSPITEISVNLSYAILGTPTSSNNNNAEIGSASIFDPIETSNASSGIETDDSSEGTVTETNDDDDAYGLISNRNSTSFRVRRLNMDATMNFDDDKTTTMAVDDVSFYENHSDNLNLPSYSTSPLAEKANLLSPEGSPERFIIVESNAPIFTKLRSLDEISSNSTDSGYGPYSATNSSIDSVNLTNNRTMAPLSRKSLISTMQNIGDKNDTTNSFRTFNSLSSDSMDSIDDDYMELLDMESLDNENSNQRPSDLNSLISGHIKTVRSTPEMKRPNRRCLSLNDNNNAIRALSTLFEPKTPEILRSGQENVCSETITPFSSSRLNAERCFKRPEPPSTTDSPINSKRYKTESDEKENDENEISFRPLRKSVSMNENQILSALSRSSAEPQLIGDFSAPYMLPLTDGRHHDLKSISSDTMANLLRGKYSNTIASYKVIDCRYPYEFEGGHIRGAYNLYTHEQINELFNTKTDESTVEADGPKRNILIFHCEFSSERGPKLSRFLRSRDRLSNSTIYPALHYPEVYLLHGGYKEFFENNSELCDPIAYRTMLDPSYGNELKHFRAKSKSWTGDLRSFGGGSTQRLKKSRSRLVL